MRQSLLCCNDPAGKVHDIMPAKTKVRKKSAEDERSQKKTSNLNNEDVEGIKADVAAFAAQLGLAGAGADAGFDDSDFKPQKAQQKFENAAKPKRTKGQSESQDSRQVEKKTSAPTKTAGAKQGSDSNALVRRPENGSQEVDPRVRERTWNTGVGPRPGDALCLAPPLAAEVSLLSSMDNVADNSCARIQARSRASLCWAQTSRPSGMRPQRPCRRSRQTAQHSAPSSLRRDAPPQSRPLRTRPQRSRMPWVSIAPPIRPLHSNGRAAGLTEGRLAWVVSECVQCGGQGGGAGRT